MADIMQLFPDGPPSRSSSSMINDGVETLLSRFCPHPDVLRPVFERQPRRVRTLRDNEILCKLGDPASELWIIIDGQIRVEKASYALWRQKGEVVGEAELYQIGPQRRGSTLSACGDVSVFRIDRQFLEDLGDAARSIWHETMARVLAFKLDQAAEHRDRLRNDKLDVDALITRFVCSEGREAALAVLSEGPDGRIDPESSQAIIWFSDMTGFSALVETLELRKAAVLVRELMTLQERAVHAHGGQIDKYMGDGIMAFWRCPGEAQLSNASNAAVSAALECAQAVARFAQDRHLPCDIRIGLHGGPVMIGDFGGDERIAFTLIGQAVNEASRYEQAGRCSGDRPLGRLRISPCVFERLTLDTAIQAFEPEMRRFLDKHGRLFDIYSSRL